MKVYIGICRYLYFYVSLSPKVHTYGTLETLATLARVQSKNDVFTKNTKTVGLQTIEVDSLSFGTSTLETLATLAQSKDKKSSSKKHRMVFNSLKDILYFFIWYHTNSSIAFYEGQPL